MAILIPKFRGEEIDPAKRRLLVAMLEAGALSAGFYSGIASAAAPGERAGLLAKGRNIYSLTGTATVNGAEVTRDAVIKPGDTVATGARSRLIFTVDDNAYVLRENGKMALPKDNDVSGALRLFTGALLSVFGRRKRRLSTAAATIGIRGTGVYLESNAEETYICTCFGTADLIPVASGEVAETVETEHHDAPRYALASGTDDKLIRNAPFKNHTDAEVALIETIVGRTPPIQFTLEAFDSPFNAY